MGKMEKGRGIGDGNERQMDNKQQEATAWEEGLWNSIILLSTGFVGMFIKDVKSTVNPIIPYSTNAWLRRLYFFFWLELLKIYCPAKKRSKENISIV